MKRAATITAILLITSALHPVWARLIDERTFEELFVKAGFVVIAKPISVTHDTPERGVLLGNVPVIGVITEFQTLLVLKGAKQERFMLHHYRNAPLPSGVAIVNGPTLISFDPKDDHRPYLLFLVREPDGRFAPVASQTDLDVSVRQVGGIAE
jgi:hypothetical protein